MQPCPLSSACPFPEFPLTTFACQKPFSSPNVTSALDPECSLHSPVPTTMHDLLGFGYLDGPSCHFTHQKGSVSPEETEGPSHWKYKSILALGQKEGTEGRDRRKAHRKVKSKGGKQVPLDSEQNREITERWTSAAATPNFHLQDSLLLSIPCFAWITVSSQQQGQLACILKQTSSVGHQKEPVSRVGIRKEGLLLQGCRT